MVATIGKTRPKPTRDETFALIKAVTRISLYGEQADCPRCSKPLEYEQRGNSFIIACSDESCIKSGGRGI